MKQLICLLITLSYLFQASYLSSQPQLTYTSWQTGFDSPVDISNAGDGTNRLFIVERDGVIRIIENDSVRGTPFLDIQSIVGCCGERGLLGLAFHPDYANNGYFYVHYIDNGNDSNISRFSVSGGNANVADASSELIILEIEQPYTNHNGGELAFHPTDGYLYIAMGDGGSGNDPGDRAQDPDCLHGKILRIDVDGGGNAASASQSGGDCDFTSTANYTIPADNPFVGSVDTLDEIWSLGWRNPWKFSFDSANGNMWIADVGQDSLEEVNFEANGDSGKNYGWRCYEGGIESNTSGCGSIEGYTFPVFDYPHPEGFSVTGGFVYRGSLYPNMVGYYMVTDFVTEKTWTIFRNNDDTYDIEEQVVAGINSISSYGEDEDGEIYAASLGGTIYQVSDASVVPVDLISFEGKLVRGNPFLTWQTANEIELYRFEIEKSTDLVDFHRIGEVYPYEGLGFMVNQYQYVDLFFEEKKAYYRLKMVDIDGLLKYSNTIALENSEAFDFQVSPNPNIGHFKIDFKGAYDQIDIKLIDPNGFLVWVDSIEGQGAFSVEQNLSTLPPGIYYLQVSNGTRTISKRILKI